MQYSSATPRRRPAPASGASAPEADDAEREIVRRAMATSGPVEIAELGDRLKMTPATLEKHLLALEAKGLIFSRPFHAARGAALGALPHAPPRPARSNGATATT